MRKSVLFLALVYCTSGFAATQDLFVCRTNRIIEPQQNSSKSWKKPTQVKFLVRDLDTRSAQLDEFVKDDPEPIRETPKDSILDLNDNTTFGVNANRLEITSDGDGCSWTTFVLFRKMDFRGGYARVKGDKGCGSGDAYSEVVCQRQRRQVP